MTDLAKIEKIYHAALEKLPAEREAFLREACGVDEALRREVESLLSFDELAADFIETPPGGLAAELVGAKGKDDDLSGRDFAHYRILAPLGAGGMGEVYLAEDTKLGRKIALKLLPPQLSAHPERKARFAQEARAASALNHPNIITIYGIEEVKEFNFIATEYIEGQTLRERLADGALPVSESLDIAVQIASALEAAHSVGIVHRDIKPANIMIRRDGIVKVLDFGLAKLTMSSASTPDAETKKRLQTKSGMVMGTVAYMSPEQALGENLDARSDVFSFGVVLYEMLTGAQPFSGSSDAAIYNAILNKDVPLVTQVKQNLPRDLEEIIRRAMQKNPEERFQTAADLRVALESVRQRLNSGADLPANRSFKRITKIPWKKAAATMATLAIIFSAIVFFLFFNKMTGGVTWQSAKNVNYTQLTKLSGAEMYPSLSPDGKTFLYSSRAEGNWDIFFQRVGGMNAVNLTKDSKADDRQAVYSPDGNQIAFRSERDRGGIFLMGATGESVRRLTDSGFYPSFSPDGKEIVFSSEDFEEPMNRGVFSYLWAVNIATGVKRQLTGQDSIQPNWSPSGARIAFWGYSDGPAHRDIWTISAKGGEAPRRITDDAAVDWNPVWSPDGKYLYFLSDRGGSMNLWRIPVDEQTGAVTGEPETITTPSVYSQHLCFSRDGRNFAYVQSVNYSNVYKTGFDPRAEKASPENVVAVTQGTIWATNPELSSDGEWLAFDNTGDKQEDIFLIKPDGTELRQLTNDAYKDRVPRFSPDGKQIAFFSDRSGKYEGWIINTDGSNLRQATDITKTGKWVQLPIWSPDGKKLLYNRNFDLPLIFDPAAPLEAQTPEILPVEKALEQWVMMHSWSPDGKKLVGYIVSNGLSISGIVVYSFDTRRYEKIFDFGTRPVWLADSRRLLFYQKDKIYLLDSLTGKPREILSVAPHRVQSIAVSADNRTFFYSLQKTEADVWLGNFE